MLGVNLPVIAKIPIDKYVILYYGMPYYSKYHNSILRYGCTSENTLPSSAVVIEPLEREQRLYMRVVDKAWI
jgi:hypothetical protein